MQSLAHGGRRPSEGEARDETSGFLLDWGWRYDLVVWLLDAVLGGKLRALRRRALDAAELRPDEAVLDVGCGTGTLAMEAHARVGDGGRVVGLEPAPRQLSRARSKAERLGAGHLGVQHLAALMEEAGFVRVELTEVQLPRLPHVPTAGIVLGRRPSDTEDDMTSRAIDDPTRKLRLDRTV
jgi:SAM-dependent methyltransferase